MTRPVYRLVVESAAPRLRRLCTWLCLALLVLCFSTAPAALARDASRDLRRMIGYTIVDASSVSRTWESRRGDKYVELENGRTFRVSLLLLSPLSFTDVIVFAKGKDSEATSIKLLIENEVYDAELVE